MHSTNQLSDNFAGLWPLDPGVTFLNHGSFGACPLVVLEAQQRLRERMEQEPVRFFAKELEERLDAARQELALFVGAEADGLVFVPNATHGVNSVLRSLHLRPGDEILTTDHEYQACLNALEFAASQSGARVVVAKVPFPLDSPGRVIESVLACVNRKTRLALIDHVTSPTGLILPIAQLVRSLQELQVDTLVDGAHAPGMLSLDIKAIGASYYTGNCHKWLCAPKGAGFLYVCPDRREAIRPLSISLGASSRRSDRSRFHLEFDYTGTHDPTPFLCVPEAIRFMDSLLQGGFSELMAHNRSQALQARDLLCAALGAAKPCPDEMLGSLASVQLPDCDFGSWGSPSHTDPLQRALFERFNIEVPIIPWPDPSKRLVRVSAQIYNHPEQYQQLASALTTLLSLEHKLIDGYCPPAK